MTDSPSRDLCTILHKIVAAVDDIIGYDIIGYDNISIFLDFSYRHILYCLRDLYYLVDTRYRQQVDQLKDRAYTATQYSYLYNTSWGHNLKHSLCYLYNRENVFDSEVKAAREHLKSVGLKTDNYVDFSLTFITDVKTFAEHHLSEIVNEHLSKIANDLLWS